MRASCAFAAAALLVATTAFTREPPLRLREVTVASEVKLDGTRVRQTLDREVLRAARSLTLPHAKSGRAFDVSMAVSKRAAANASNGNGNAAGPELVVSAAVRDGAGGNLLGMTEGRARAISLGSSGSHSAAQPLDEEPLIAEAARGALTRVGAVVH